MSDHPRIQSYRNLSRPKAVIYAMYLGVGALSLQASLNIANLVINRSAALGPYPQFAAILYLVLAGFFVLQAFLIYGIWLGRNLPRIVYVGFALLGLVITVANGGWAERLSVQPLTTGLSVLAMCEELTAATLLVSHASNAWFREMQTAAASQRATRAQERKDQGPPRRYNAGTLAIAFAVSLSAAWLLYNLVLGWRWGAGYAFDPYFNTPYAMVWLPIDALVMLMGAGIGAISTRIPEARWRRATYGVWGAGLLIALLFALFAGVMSGSS